MIFCVALCFAACGGKAERYGDKFDHGTVDLKISDCGLSEHVVRIDGKSDTTVFFEGHEYSFSLRPGTHRIHVWADVEGVFVIGDVAYVEAVSTGGVLPYPERFFSSATTVTVDPDGVHSVVALMKGHLRELVLVVDGFSEGVESIRGRLSGVAGSMNIDTEILGESSTVEMDFVRGEDGLWRSTARMFGVVGSVQTFRAEVTYLATRSDDRQEPSAALSEIGRGVFEKDLSDELRSFNDDKNSPMHLVMGL